MAKNKKELWILLTVVALVALWIAQRNRLKETVTSARAANYMVIQTRYSHPYDDSISLLADGKKILDQPEAFEWEKGSTAQEVFTVLGPPDHTVEFMGGDYYLWRRDVKYDWDETLKYDGKYLAVGISYWGRTDSVRLYEELPPNSVPWGDRKVDELLEQWKDR